MSFANFKKRLYKKIRQSLFLEQIHDVLIEQNQLKVSDYINNHLYNNPKYQSSKRLNKHEFQSFSQFGEDGIIEEIFKRIGLTNSYFVEFGVENGVETNSTYLLHKGWQGLWIDGSDNNVAQINQFFHKTIQNKKLKVVSSFITAENIESIFNKAEVPKEFDLLSIDIDRNDYYVWQAIQNYSPRVVAIEYNAIFKPGCEFVVDYDANAIWDSTSYHGASIESLNDLAIHKGYSLVGCSFAGVNAFFVRNDLLTDKFESPFTTENHYEPPRYFLQKKDGHPRSIRL